MSEFVLIFDGLPHFNAAVNSVLIGFTGRLRSCSTSPERMKMVPSSKPVADGDVTDDYAGRFDLYFVSIWRRPNPLARAARIAVT